MKTLIDLLKQSVLTQALITVIVLAVIAYQSIAGRVIDDNWWKLAILIVGFYFGSKVGISQGIQQSINNVRKDY